MEARQRRSNIVYTDAGIGRKRLASGYQKGCRFTKAYRMTKSDIMLIFSLLLLLRSEEPNPKKASEASGRKCSLQHLLARPRSIGLAIKLLKWPGPDAEKVTADGGMK